jgi:23S rRNA U2552 (ribose-2'-O)-methylase RlmE/FtsJ
MTSLYVPKIIKKISDNEMKIKLSDKEPQPYINKSLSKYLALIKNKIDAHPHDWNNNKKYTNIYEFIHTNINQHGNSISKLEPISRAFYKLVEVLNTNNILDNYPRQNIKTFHLAEAPGGFIEAMSYLRKNPNDMYYGTTLIDSNNPTIPKWKHSTIVTDSNIIIDNGIDNTGNLYNEDNFLYYNENFFDQFDIVTADGGIDFSADFEKQEILAFKLILCEIFYAITMLKDNGCFVLKIFDIFYKPTLQCIYLLSSIFKECIITKPKTSRSANSEKYIVCKYFDSTNRSELISKFYKILKVINNLDKKLYFEDFLNIDMNHFFVSKILEINSIIGNKQIKNILTTIKLIENNEKRNEKITNFKNENIQKCIQWCIKNNIPYHKKYKPANIFLTKKLNR